MVERIHDPNLASQRTVVYTSSRKKMIDVGARIQVPKQDDLQAWERLYDHISGYDGDGINELSRNENEN